MILKIIFASMMALCTSEPYTPSTDEYLFGFYKFFPEFNVINLFDGPPNVSNAPTTPTTTTTPTLEQMMYYNYYSVSTYSPYELEDLSCLYCQNFKKDVIDHTVVNNNFHNTLVMVTVSENREEMVIAYRGTSNIWNAVLDAILINVNTGDSSSIKMHKGFYIATMSLYEDVVKYVGYQLSLHPDYKIVITGHSLGAAMARITAYFFITLKQFPGAPMELYTFGEPRVGNKPLADFFNTQNITTARIVARADIVPHIPPTSLLGTKILGDYYVHPQTEYWVNGKDGQRFCDQNVYEDPTCSQSIGLKLTIVDHNTLYFDAIYLTAFAAQPAVTLSLPFNIFEPVGTIPPLPKHIANFTGTIGSKFATLISPPLGR